MSGACVARSWTRRTTIGSPPARHGASLVHDAARNVTVLHGGRNGTTPVGGTWEFAGGSGTWSLVSNSGPTSDFSAMAWDPVHHEAVLFGGFQTGGETWTWNGSTWSQRTPATTPPERAQHAMAWDPDRQRVVLFGGRSTASTNRRSDLWEWDGSTWQQRPTSTGPVGLVTTMAYDTARHVLVVFAPQDQLPNHDLWELGSGTSWLLRSPSSPPSARFGAAVAFDASSSRVVVVGGKPDSTTYLADAFATDGVTWSTLSPSCGERAYAAITWDSARRKLVVFGGVNSSGPLSDTWEF